MINSQLDPDAEVTFPVRYRFVGVRAKNMFHLHCVLEQAQLRDCTTIVHALCKAMDAETIVGKYTLRQQRDAGSLCN